MVCKSYGTLHPSSAETPSFGDRTLDLAVGIAIQISTYLCKRTKIDCKDLSVCSLYLVHHVITKEGELARQSNFIKKIRASTT